jgi:hypothetical protein
MAALLSRSRRIIQLHVLLAAACALLTISQPVRLCPSRCRALPVHARRAAQKHGNVPHIVLPFMTFPSTNRRAHGL